MVTARSLDIPFGRPMLGEEERAAVLEVLASPQLVHGPQAATFERQFADFIGTDAHATSVSSCTAGLHLAYMHLGIGPGDEVIIPALTHVATAHAVEITGARPVFVDCDETGNIDVNAISPAITSLTRAICIVHYPGMPVDMVEIMRIAQAHGLKVIEDCALALGAYLDGTHCGLFGDVSSFSFYPAKHITTGEGGMVISRHAETSASIANIKAFGYDRGLTERSTPGVYDIVRLGLNYRMSEISAAIGIEQLKKASSFAARRSENMARLRSNLADLPLDLLPDGDSRKVHANYCLIARLDAQSGISRNELLRGLKAQGIGGSVYYPVPLPLSGYYKRRYGATSDEFLNAQSLAYESLALPVGPHLGMKDMDAIAEVLHDQLTKG
mgnify:CR=1 FL=1